ncbi:hypothetical protein F511_11563 [Dorcoceras hygrometricum]|uniref:Myb/SANT-like domain-containing protein n=1 Tax=Dorcoceras hygrometricum TaxID=472368 RepID=A0A2Z7D0X2_9LAMI|nr:hypothetical protein F511_11563 [Dorcoceras hygrometricum]
MGDSQGKYNVWTIEESNELLKIMVDSAMRGWRDINGLFSKKTIEKKILPALNEKLGCEKTFTQYQSRLKWFKLRYNNYCKLMRHNSGFGWDSNTKKFTAAEEVWEDYLKPHPKHEHYRSDTFEDYEDLRIVVGNGTAIGKYSIGLGDDTDARTYETEENRGTSLIDDYVFDSGSGGFVQTDGQESLYQPLFDEEFASPLPSHDITSEIPPSTRKRDRTKFEQNKVHSRTLTRKFYINEVASPHILLPAVASNITETLAQIRASVDQIRFEQIRCKDDVDRLRDTLLMHIRDIEKKSTERFDELDRVIRASRIDSQGIRTILSLDIRSSQKQLSAQIAAAAIDNVDVRREVKEIHAKIDDLDRQVATIRSEQLDFRAKAEENYLNLSTQLGDIVDFLRGGDAKKGQGSSSRPQPPPDDHSRPSEGTGGSGSGAQGQSRPGLGSGNRGSGSGISQSKGNRSGSSKRRTSGDESHVRNIRYGPYPPTGVPKRSTKHWITGEKDF